MIEKITLSNALSQEASTIERIAGIPSGFSTADIALGGVFMMYHRNSDNHPLMVRPRAWTNLQNSGEIADGVILVEGGRMLVISPTESETTLPWSSAPVSAGGFTTNDRMAALNDWTGKTNTAEQIKHAECSGVGYAPGFCAAYSRVNANGKGMTAGRWWQPSVGQAVMMSANMDRVNYALSLINGATPLTGGLYLCSTEADVNKSWVLYLGDGVLSSSSKTGTKGKVRPVSEFLY